MMVDWTRIQNDHRKLFDMKFFFQFLSTLFKVILDPEFRNWSEWGKSKLNGLQRDHPLAWELT